MRMNEQRRGALYLAIQRPITDARLAILHANVGMSREDYSQIVARLERDIWQRVKSVLELK